ncbi:MAG: hypothetical protein WA719_01440 [Thermoplasmata archaeon]
MERKYSSGKTVPTLSVVCHHCGQEFPSEVPFRAREGPAPRLEGIVYECPHCGTRDPYFAADHQPPSRDEGQVARRSISARWKDLHPRLAGLWRVLPVLLFLFGVLVLLHRMHSGSIPHTL